MLEIYAQASENSKRAAGDGLGAHFFGGLPDDSRGWRGAGRSGNEQSRRYPEGLHRL